LFCTANDQCDTNGVCIGGADPCTGNPECQDTCNEAADNCLSLGGTACGSPVSNQCNGADTCDGAGTCQANLAGPGTPAPVLCNDTNECTDDVCDGAGTCSNPNVAMGTACGDPTDSECANPDSCDGAGACLDNDEAPGDACGDPSDTDCTNPDTCDLAGDCVANDETPGTACGNPSDDECNGADTCDGAGTCEANVSAPGVPAPTTCADGNECTADLCDGTGGCTNPDEAPGTACGDATALPCNQADSCDGLGACLANLLPDATPCDDNDACTLFDACDGGVCTPTDAVECDDGILCTYDTCDPMSGNCVFIDAPAPSCHAAPLAQLKIVDKEDDTHDKLKWKWVKGEETLFSELGTPDTTTTYEFCLYDSVGGVSTLVASMTIPPSSKWRAKNDKLYKYKDRTASAGGISKIKARALPSPTMGVKAQGLNFPTPMPFSLEEFFDQDPMVSAQLVTDEGQCWAADFTEARRNTGNRFIAKRLGIIIK